MEKATKCLHTLTELGECVLEHTTNLPTNTQTSPIYTKIIGFIPSLLFRIVSFTTITIPLFFYRILTWSFTLHLNFSSLVILIATLVIGGYLIIRYRFLTKYSRLKPINPQKSAPSFDLHPDTGEDAGYSKPNLKNYPDEFLSVFLSGIKIFGYLEEPVFHELARHLQTKKLLAGDTLFRSPEQERSFYIVVDGHVQMFVKPDNENDDDDDDDDDDSFIDNEMDDDDDSDYYYDSNDDSIDDVDSGSSGFHDDAKNWKQGKKKRYDKFKNYTLINEVSQGGTLSSLFTILSIFRESFNRSILKEKSKNKSMRQQIASRSSSLQQDSNITPQSLDMLRKNSDDWRHVFPNLENQASGTGFQVINNSSTETTPDISPINSKHQRKSSSSSTRSNTSNKNTKHSYVVTPMTYIQPQEMTNDESILTVGPSEISQSSIANDPIYSQLKQHRFGKRPASFSSSVHRKQYRSVHPNIIARATVDTTLAVIPEEAFHKLTQKFPKAASHIVQVIVTRFQRVTLMTSHRYLGLTTELLRLEKLINESVCNHELFWNESDEFFLPGTMERLHKKFAEEESMDDTSGKSIATSNSTLNINIGNNNNNNNNNNNKSAAFSPAGIDRVESPINIIQSIDILNSSSPKKSVLNQMGDQLMDSSNSPSASTSTDLRKRHQRQKQQNSTLAEQNVYSVEDDEHLRYSVVKCFSNSLGIKMEDQRSNGSGNNSKSSLSYINNHHITSPPSSRRTNQPKHQQHMMTATTSETPSSTSSSSMSTRNIYPMDLFSQTGNIDSNTSPSLSALNIPYDDDIDNISVVSSVHSGNESFSGTHSSSSSHILPEEVMILYFPEGAVLAREKEHLNGLYFIIDGLLEASMTPTEGEEENAALLQTNLGNKDKRSKRKSMLKRRKSTNLVTIKDIEIENANINDNKADNKDNNMNNDDDKGDNDGISTNLFPTWTQQNRAHDQTIASEAPAGRIPITQKEQSNKKQIKKPKFLIYPGGIVGYLDALTGHPSFVDIRAKTNTYIGYLPKKTLNRIIDKNPTVMMKLAKQLVDSLSALLLHIDLSLEWMQVNAGQIISRENEPIDSIYMVLHGRLRTIRERKEGDLEILGEFGHGESVGELEVLTGSPTSATLHAIRDSEIARIPKTLFNALAHRHPEITLQVSRLIAYRSLQLVINKNIPVQNDNVSLYLRNTDDSVRRSLAGTIGSNFNHTELYGKNNVNLKTIGILPVNSSVPLAEFATTLKNSLQQDVGASCILLNSATITTVMGKHAFSRMGKLKIASWLAEQEEKARIVLYLADGGVNSQWTRTCIRQADCILLVGLGDDDPSIGEYERYMINTKTTARKELVLLHRERSCIPGSTRNWLKNRLWIQAHHHMFMPMKRHTTLSTDRTQPPWLATQGRKMTESSLSVLSNVKGQLEKYYSTIPTFGRLLNKKRGSSLTSVNSLSRNDFARLARRLCGKSVALVLGGGGARGVSHIGVIQALEEAGIPIDIIGGTSIGSFVGGLYAKELDLVTTIARGKLFAGRVSSIWRQIMDLTYPVTAWFTGHEFNRAIWKCLGDSLIEDFWLPYFAVTTNITYSKMEVHTTGYAWRYIRASMSLSGYMPPICDNGNMLVDGGYMDNLPVTVAKSMGADIVIAVDVASDDDTSPVYYGDSISGWWALLHSYNPFRTYNIPSIAEIQSRLAYVSSVPKLEEAKITDGTLYVKLPVQQWGTLEFGKFNDIKTLGYDVGKVVIGRWRKAGYATGRLNADDDDEGKWLGQEVKGKRGRRNSV
ncbi:unnamed protein product [Cunninghamella blakesleeana]